MSWRSRCDHWCLIISTSCWQVITSSRFWNSNWLRSETTCSFFWARDISSSFDRVSSRSLCRCSSISIWFAYIRLVSSCCASASFRYCSLSTFWSSSCCSMTWICKRPSLSLRFASPSSACHLRPRSVSFLRKSESSSSWRFRCAASRSRRCCTSCLKRWACSISCCLELSCSLLCTSSMLSRRSSICFTYACRCSSCCSAACARA
mmetsp:Transcript_49140/g.142376  ORF Transcript_49140/g.142376 Transcript_49140/m.142376 type:complete len:206 (-) Transcript_49140:335-952(-)